MSARLRALQLSERLQLIRTRTQFVMGDAKAIYDQRTRKTIEDLGQQVEDLCALLSEAALIHANEE